MGQKKNVLALDAHLGTELHRRSTELTRSWLDRLMERLDVHPRRIFPADALLNRMPEVEHLPACAHLGLGVFPYSLQTVGDVSRRLETMVVFGLPDDYYTHYLERIAATTREEVQEVARRHLDPERLAIVAVGPAEILEPQFEGLGPVTVWTPEGQPRASAHTLRT